MRKREKHRGVYEHPKASGVWWIHYYDAAGQRHREKIGGWSRAVDKYIERKTQIRAGQFSSPNRRSKVSFAALLDEAIDAKRGRNAKGSVDGDEYKKPALIEAFGQMRAEAVTGEMAERFLSELRAQGLSGSTVNRYRSFLSSVFSHGVKRRKLQANPMKSVARHKENAGRVRFLGADEELALRAEIRKSCPEREPELDLALHTGARRGEQFGLRWECVDLDRGILELSGKTGRRFVPVNSACRTAIEKLYRASSGSAYVILEARSSGQRDWRRWFEDAAAEAKIENFTWHDLRHTFASRLVMAGVDLRTVQQLMGHRSIVQTMRYSHLAPDHLRASVEKLGSTFVLQPALFGAAEPARESTAIKQPSAKRPPMRKVRQVV